MPNMPEIFRLTVSEAEKAFETAPPAVRRATADQAVRSAYTKMLRFYKQGITDRSKLAGFLTKPLKVSLATAEQFVDYFIFEKK